MRNITPRPWDGRFTGGRIRRPETKGGNAKWQPCWLPPERESIPTGWSPSRYTPTRQCSPHSGSSSSRDCARTKSNLAVFAAKGLQQVTVIFAEDCVLQQIGPVDEGF